MKSLRDASIFCLSFSRLLINSLFTFLNWMFSIILTSSSKRFNSGTGGGLCVDFKPNVGILLRGSLLLCISKSELSIAFGGQRFRQFVNDISSVVCR